MASVQASPGGGKLVSEADILAAMADSDDDSDEEDETVGEGKKGVLGGVCGRERSPYFFFFLIFSHVGAKNKNIFVCAHKCRSEEAKIKTPYRIDELFCVCARVCLSHHNNLPLRVRTPTPRSCCARVRNSRA